MPDHIHLLLTPTQHVTIERSVQLIKGGYSHALGTIRGRNAEVWQRGFTDHRIRDPNDFAHHRNYIHQNPVAGKLATDRSTYRYCSAFPRHEWNSCPSRFAITIHEAHQYFLGRGAIRLASTASNSNFGSSKSGAKVAFVVFIQFLSSRSGKSGL